ncbi:MAG: hypothetical protein NC402_07920 [Prevotella sp.]|nr:hypothetical protein [Prevotella sp.]MCM1075669.1 hypothetical protein [Ruminococcus sp.]
MIKKTADVLSEIGAAVASWLKVPFMSGNPTPGNIRKADEELVILGNGPSLKQTLAEEMPALMSRQRMVVNFAANAPEFFELRPQFYILADPHFFAGEATDPNVARLWRNIGKTEWPMILYVPCKQLKEIEVLHKNKNLIFKGFNLTPAEGTPQIVHPLYDFGWAMPRPRNVMIPAIMVGIREGFKTIYIAGADHTWSKTLEVDDRNRVISVQPHFYEDNAEEQKRVETTYANYHLHDILKSLYVAFRSYHQIQAWASDHGVRIINITPGSFIDAFPRQSHI